MSRLIACLTILTLLSACGGSSGGNAGNGGGSGGAGATGLDTRPANLTCAAPARTGGNVAVALEPAFPMLQGVNTPLSLLQAPGDNGRWFAAERGGTVRVFDNTADVSSTTQFVSIPVNASGEGGLLGVAFDPEFGVAGNTRVYLSWTEGNPMQSVVGRFTSSNGGLTLDPAYDEIIRIDQDATNHNGGQIAFGNDGYLYFGLGDGGGAGDPNDRAQDTTNLLGAMLRLDVSGTGDGYAIPPDNPFFGNPQCPGNHSGANACPEIYAWGLRNPWRWSFDAVTGDLWLGDVGQGAREEIDRIERGGNYGWDCREGNQPYSPQSAQCPSVQGTLVDPVHDYNRAQGDISVTGGYVYRGSALTDLVGSYIFGDFGSGRIWRLVDDGQGGFVAEELLDHSGNILSFAQGNDGELYVLDGGIQRIVAGSGGSGGGVPVASQLSATGCFDTQDPAQAVSGLIPYEVNAPFWSDGADKERWFAIPDGTTISVDVDGDFVFPAGTVLAKHFRLGGELVETRLFMRHPDGGWAGYTYEWNAAGSDADLVIGGKTADKNGQQWIYPSEGQCLRCHTSAAGGSLGLEVAQLNNDFTYTETGRTHNQLETLDDIGMFTTPLGDASVLPAFVHPGDAAATLDDRARSYLHTNCSQCHRPEGPTPTDLDLRASTLLENTNACSITPQAGDLGIANPLIIAPGEPARSVLPARMNTRDANGMPPLGSNLIDADGVALLEAWIAGLDPGCQ